VVNNTLAADGVNNYFLRFNIYSSTWYLNGRRVPDDPLFAIITSADIPADNGVIQEIDEILIPPGPDEQQTILESLAANPAFSIMSDALTEVDLSGVNLTAYTLFAPTDDAFTFLPPGVRNIILGDPVALQQFVLYHMVSSTYFTVGLLNSLYPTLEGNPVAVFRPALPVKRQTDVTGPLIVNGVQASQTNLHREDGVIHVLDHVLFPPDLCLAPKGDGGRSLADASFWCQQLRSALQRRYHCVRYLSSDLLEFVQWIANTSSYFSGVTTLTEAKNLACGSTSSLDTLTYALWLDVASGNTFVGANVVDFCDPYRTSSWYTKQSYDYHCTQFSFNTTTTTPPPDLGTVGDLLRAAESALISQNRTARTVSTTNLHNLFQKQPPGASGCPNTCGASATAARAISDQTAYYEDSSNLPSGGMSAGTAAAIGSAVTAVVVIVIIAVLVASMRDRVAQFISTKDLP